MAYHVDYKALKSKVGIDDIAISLGYRLNRQAGIGRFIELVLPDGQGGKKDTIVISHPNDKGRQTYFRRDDGVNKDVISFILENQNSFGISGKNKWDIVSKVMSKFANEPLVETQAAKEYASMRNNPYPRREFDPKEYEVHSVAENPKAAQYVFDQRNISADTVRDFAPYLDRIKYNRHDRNTNFFNIGFPYHHPGNDKVVGYEIRGVGGFKSKAVGTDSAHAAWIVDFTNDRNPSEIKNVFFAESGFDVMAMYQANKTKLQSKGELDKSVFVSLGGALSRTQVSSIMQHYSNARAVDCFDNDLPGRIYGLRMVDAVEGLGLVINHIDDKVRITYKGKEHEFDASTVNLDDLRGFVKLKRDYGISKAPSNFKDWNDVLLHKPINDKIPQETKYDRNENLENKRKSGLKI